MSNPYWEELAPSVEVRVNPFQSEQCHREVGGLPAGPVSMPADGSLPPWASLLMARDVLTARYCFTIPDPDTVAFVAAHAGPAVLDPFAGTGYWARLLTGAGLDVLAYDLHPPDGTAGSQDEVPMLVDDEDEIGGDGNPWHHGQAQHVPVGQGDAAQVVADHGAGRTLLMSWPPQGPEAAAALAAYPGETVVYIGEFNHHISGDGALYARLTWPHWEQVAEHVPVRWAGVRDTVRVFRRIPVPALGWLPSVPPCSPGTHRIGDAEVEVRLVLVHDGTAYRLQGLSTATHHLDLVLRLFGTITLTETQRAGPEGAEYGWARAWDYDGDGALVMALVAAIIWRTEFPDGSAGEPQGWFRAIDHGVIRGAEDERDDRFGVADAGETG